MPRRRRAPYPTAIHARRCERALSQATGKPARLGLHTRRYGERHAAEPLVVFVCRDRRRARESAQRADLVMRACRAYAGEYPFDWEYPGRERVLFVAERDMHEGMRRAYGIRRLPPSARVAEARGDPQAGGTSVQSRELP